MGVIIWIILGALAGWAASVLTRGNMGVSVDVVLGVVGALVGGFIMSLFGQSGVTGFNAYSFIVALIGAVVVVYVGRLVRSV